MDRSRRNLALAAALALALAGLAAALLWPRAPGPETAAGPADAAPALARAEPPDADAPAPAPREAVVAAVEGKVERLRGDDWASVQVGDTVKAEDSLRTAPQSRADLEIGEASRLTVSEDTQVKVAELTAAVHRFKIKRGRVAAAYQADGARVLRIEGESGEAVAEARVASFSVRATDTSFAVATETGTVNLKAAGSEVAVGAGQLSVASASQAPSPAAPIPASVLLKVAAAAVSRSDPCSVVEGVASPGAEVRVEGELAAVDPDGHFQATVEAKGRREVRVVMRDVQGNTREERIACASRPPRKGDAGSGAIEKMNINWEKD